MPNKRDLKAAALRILTREEPPRKDHPVRHFAQDEGFKQLPIELVQSNPDQPRKHFDKAALDDLTASVKQHGVLQTIIVRKAPEGEKFTIIAGERRWRAAKAAGLTEIPAIVRLQEDSREIAIIENMQRENLNPIELAEGLADLKKMGGYTDAQLAHVIGKSRQAVNDSLLLNNLPEAIKAECRTSGTYTKSQLLQILRAGSPQKIDDTWGAVKKGDLPTVRDLRKHTAAPKRGRPKSYRFDHQPKGKPYHVTVTFTKRTASRAELRAALKDALKHLP